MLFIYLIGRFKKFCWTSEVISFCERSHPCLSGVADLQFYRNLPLVRNNKNIQSIPSQNIKINFPKCTEISVINPCYESMLKRVKALVFR